MQENFTDEYELKELYEYPLTDVSENFETTFLGSAKEKVCIFCMRDSKKTTFKKEAHVFPASLGNRFFFNHDECDECNEVIGRLENELSNYLMIERILVGAKKRSGFPKYKPIKNGYTKLEVDTDTSKKTRTVNMQINPLEDRFETEVDEEKKTLTYTINNPPSYSLADVCKAISHSGWTIMNASQRSKINYLTDWILGKAALLPLYLDVGFIKGNGLTHAFFEVWESNSKNSLYPFLFRFTFGVRILTLYIPKTLDVKVAPKRFNCYVAIPENLEINISGQKIISDERVKTDKIAYKMSYEKIDKYDE